METVVSTPVEPELQLLTSWGEPDDADRRRRAAIATLLFHVAGIATLFLLPKNFFEQPKLPDPPIRHVTPLVEPLTRLTQKAPNPTKVAKEFSATERGGPRHLAPPPAPPPPREPVRKAVIPQAPPPKQTQNAQPLPEPPKAEPQVTAPKTDAPQFGVLPPPPKIQEQEQPKLALQNLQHAPPTTVPPDQRLVPLPDTSVNGALQRSLQNPSRPPQLPPPGPENGHSMELPQLLTDAQGVDFTPYLRAILQTVRRNWQTVIPESARLGQRGKVSIVLSISRDGKVIKLVFAEQSGTDSLDKAAVSGVSMSNPFPPLPSQFKGDHIAVQFNFAYNAPKQ